MLIVSALALVVGAAVGVATGGRPGHIGRHHLRAWWLVALGVGLQVAADRFDLGIFGTVVVLLGTAALLSFAVRNPHLVGIGVVAVGVGANALVIGLNDGMPVRPSAVVAAHVASASEEPVLGYGYRHHRQTTRDQLAGLADIIPVPVFHEVVSFGDLILAVGVAATVAQLLRPGARHSRWGPARVGQGDLVPPVGSVRPSDGEGG